MKKINLFLIIAALIFSAAGVSAQKLIKGDVKMLKGQTVLNLRYDYSGMKVGKFDNEQEYVADGIKNRNKKKEGTGDEWAKKWVSDRDDRFQPRFEENLNLAIRKFDVNAKPGANDAKYTLICHTVFTEPGFNVGVSRKDAYINMQVDIVETANPENVLASIEMKKLDSKSMGGYDLDTGARIESAYDRAGDVLGSFLNKNAFK